MAQTAQRETPLKANWGEPTLVCNGGVSLLCKLIRSLIALMLARPARPTENCYLTFPSQLSFLPGLE
jgi:hypothetical protein